MTTVEYKETLTQELARLTRDLEGVAVFNSYTGDWEATPDTEAGTDADENAEADQVEAWNERRATVAALETEYRDTVRALEKISDGTFGMCEICEKPIESDRLMFRLTARTCKEHQEEEFDLSL